MLKQLSILLLGFLAISPLCLYGTAGLNAKSHSNNTSSNTLMQRELQSELVDEPPLAESPAVTMKATFYANSFHGRKTSSGERYDKTKLTCAHRKFPFNTLLKIKNPDNGKEIVVRVNDRGPFARGFDLDISYEAASQLGMVRAGVKKLEVRVLGVNGQEVAQGSK